MPEEEKKVSKFSSGINILIRLDQLWKNCHSFKRNGQFSKWNDELDTVWLELARDLKKEDYYDTNEKGNIVSEGEKVKQEGFKKQFDRFDEKLKELLPFSDSGAMGFEKPSDDSKKIRNKQYQLLMEKQLFLARLENELGKGTSWGESEDDWD